MSESLYADEYLEYQTNRSWLRKTIRKIYLWQVRRHVKGAAIDFGCGAGEHLSTYPAGSLGLEINEATVKYCRAKGLNVQLYKPEEDNYALKEIPANTYQTLVISHVLEHLPNPAEVLSQLMAACERVGIKRIFICVPCEVGFAHDKTHLTFVTTDYMREKQPEKQSAFQLVKYGYFPFNWLFAGKLFVYNELYFLYERP